MCESILAVWEYQRSRERVSGKQQSRPRETEAEAAEGEDRPAGAALNAENHPQVGGRGRQKHRRVVPGGGRVRHGAHHRRRDALFGARTDAGSSADRYANHDTAILPQQIERYRGLVMVTTNHRDQIDQAFGRRLGLTLEFARPDHRRRVALRKRNLPVGMLVSGLEAGVRQPRPAAGFGQLGMTGCGQAPPALSLDLRHRPCFAA
jgi:hypothetical protein